MRWGVGPVCVPDGAAVSDIREKPQITLAGASLLQQEPEDTGIALYRDMKMAFWLPQTQAALMQAEG